MNTLLYKNIFWWGLDLVADGLVLIFVAGICGAMVFLGFVIFLLNIVISIGVKGLIGIYLPSKSKSFACVPSQ